MPSFAGGHSQRHANVKHVLTARLAQFPRHSLNVNDAHLHIDPSLVYETFTLVSLHLPSELEAKCDDKSTTLLTLHIFHVSMSLTARERGEAMTKS